MKRVSKILCAFAMAVGISMAGDAAQADDREPLIIGGPEFAPLYVRNEDGTIEGSMIDLIREFADEAGYRVEGKLRPTKRMRTDLIKGISEVSILVLQTGFTPELFWRSEQAVSRLTLNLYTVNEVTPFKTLDEVRDTTMIVMAGYSYGGWRKKLEDAGRGVVFAEANYQSSALMQLVRNRAPIAMLYDVNAQEGLATLGRDLPELRHRTVQDLPLYLYISRASANADEKIKRLSAVLERRKQDAKNGSGT